jgi:hypothetical protein
MPRKINFSNIEAVTPGEFTKIPEGNYVVGIQEMKDNPDKEYVELIFDIIKGDYKGAYEDDWGAEHPFAHRMIMSYKDSAAGMLKGRLDIITKSNPGFDAEAAWNADDQTKAFFGKRFGLGMSYQMLDMDGISYLKNPRPNWFKANWGTADDAEAGTIKLPKRDDGTVPGDDDTAHTTASPAAAVYDENLPF